MDDNSVVKAFRDRGLALEEEALGFFDTVEEYFKECSIRDIPRILKDTEVIEGGKKVTFDHIYRLWELFRYIHHQDGREEEEWERLTYRNHLVAFRRLYMTDGEKEIEESGAEGFPACGRCGSSTQRLDARGECFYGCEGGKYVYSKCKHCGKTAEGAGPDCWVVCDECPLEPHSWDSDDDRWE